MSRAEFGADDKITKQVLTEDMRSRGDDKWLILKVWEKCGLYLTPEQQKLYFNPKLPTTETIRRTRQRLQQFGQYKPVEMVKQARLKLEAEVRRGGRW